MKFFYDLLPVILFFIAFKIPEDPTDGVMLATGVAIIASLLQVAIQRLRGLPVDRMQLVTLGLLVVLGGATLALQDERFIKWKPTAVNWLFALVFLGSEFIGRKNLVRRMMEGNIVLPDAVWTRLNLGWCAFFVIMGLANLYVAFNFPTEVWVDFKLFGMLGLTLLFVLAQGVYLARYADLPVSDKGGE
ncbi:MAG: septation protein A [Gammaproteobacteria bacterium]|nr:MAG: septation protein A [Gammaproteobacteria bacterium]